MRCHLFCYMYTAAEAWFINVVVFEFVLGYRLDKVSALLSPRLRIMAPQVDK